MKVIQSAITLATLLAASSVDAISLDSENQLTMRESLSLKLQQAQNLENKKQKQGHKAILEACDALTVTELATLETEYAHCAAYDTDKAKKKFKALLKKYNLKKSDLAEQATFRENVFLCRFHDLDDSYNSNKKRNKMALKYTTVLTAEELDDEFQGGILGSAAPGLRGGPENIVDLPDVAPARKSRNTVEEGFQTPVINQGNCNDCYAVAYAQIVSAKCYEDTTNLYQVSAQKFLQCARNECSPATFEDINEMAQWYQGNQYLTTTQMPLTAGDNIDPAGPLDNPASNECPLDTPVCAMDQQDDQIGVVYQPTNNQMMQAVDLYGASVIGIMSAGGGWPEFNNYNGGIMSYESLGGGPYERQQASGLPNLAIADDGSLQPYACAPVNHMVTLVGYNAESADPKEHYWIIKNSYGADMFDDGYIILAMNGAQGQDCGAISAYAGNGFFGVNTVVRFIMGKAVAPADCTTADCTQFEVKPDERSNPTFFDASAADFDGTSM